MAAAAGCIGESATSDPDGLGSGADEEDESEAAADADVLGRFSGRSSSGSSAGRFDPDDGVDASPAGVPGTGGDAVAAGAEELELDIGRAVG